MENQHRLIKTYRELNKDEIESMNACKLLEAQVEEFRRTILAQAELDLKRANTTLSNQGLPAATYEEARAIVSQATQALRDVALANTHFEDGFMRLVRSVARPAKPAIDHGVS